jgi:hypothetical protein
VSGLCRFGSNGFLVLYAVALALLLVGTFGLFGQEPDPLSGVFLIPLGLPWNRFVDYFPERLWPWLAAGSPVINYFILRLLCRFARHNGR